MSDDLTDEERALFSAYNTAEELAVLCRGLKEMGLSTPQSGIDMVINTLMTGLWDQGFSQTEICNAFDGAVADMNRYAAGEERR